MSGIDNIAMMFGIGLTIGYLLGIAAFVVLGLGMLLSLGLAGITALAKEAITRRRRRRHECDTTWVAPGEVAKMMGNVDE